MCHTCHCARVNNNKDLNTILFKFHGTCYCATCATQNDFKGLSLCHGFCGTCAMPKKEPRACELQGVGKSSALAYGILERVNGLKSDLGPMLHVSGNSRRCKPELPGYLGLCTACPQACSDSVKGLLGNPALRFFCAGSLAVSRAAPCATASGWFSVMLVPPILPAMGEASGRLPAVSCRTPMLAILWFCHLLACTYMLHAMK